MLAMRRKRHPEMALTYETKLRCWEPNQNMVGRIS